MAYIAYIYWIKFALQLHAKTTSDDSEKCGCVLRKKGKGLRCGLGGE